MLIGNNKLQVCPSNLLSKVFIPFEKICEHDGCLMGRNALLRLA